MIVPIRAATSSRLRLALMAAAMVGSFRSGPQPVVVCGMDARHSDGLPRMARSSCGGRPGSERSAATTPAPPDIGLLGYPRPPPPTLPVRGEGRASARGFINTFENLIVESHLEPIS